MDRRGPGGWSEAVCKAAGWEYCEEHRRPRYRGPSPCDRLHESTRGHMIECPYPDGECLPICPGGSDA